MHPHRVVGPEDAEHLVEHRHENAAAADPEQTREQARGEPGRQQRADQKRDLAKRHTHVHRHRPCSAQPVVHGTAGAARNLLYRIGACRR